MYNQDEHHEINFLKEGGDLDFEKAMKGLQDFSSNIIENQDSQKSDLDAFKNLDHYYEKKMNFENNEMINIPNDSMKKLDNLYGKIMESKVDKNIEHKSNKEYLGDPKAQIIPPSKPFKTNIKSKTMSSSCWGKKKGSIDSDSNYYELQTVESQPNFEKSLYDYPVMSTPSIKGSFAPGMEYIPPKNNYVETSKMYVPGIPVYYPNMVPNNVPLGQNVFPSNHQGSGPFFGQSNYVNSGYNYTQNNAKINEYNINNRKY